MIPRLMTNPVAPLPERSEPDASDSAAEELCARVRAGDQRAFDTLFLQHYTQLCAFVNSYLHAPDDAEEVVQTVFHRIWQGHSSWNPKGGGRAYLFAACRNQALHVLEHELMVSRSSSHVAEVVRGYGRATSLDDDMDTAASNARLRAAIAELPERRRRVVVLRLQYQLANAEIAQVLGISVKGVEIQLRRAILDLRQRLQKARVLGLV